MIWVNPGVRTFGETLHPRLFDFISPFRLMLGKQSVWHDTLAFFVHAFFDTGLNNYIFCLTTKWGSWLCTASFFLHGGSQKRKVVGIPNLPLKWLNVQGFPQPIGRFECLRVAQSSVGVVNVNPKCVCASVSFHSRHLKPFAHFWFLSADCWGLSNFFHLVVLFCWSFIEVVWSPVAALHHL